MALKTQGFALSALPRAPQIPGNIGQVDVKEIYDGVRRGLDSLEAVRRAPQGMALADAQMNAATQQAPLATRGVLAETEAKEAQLPIRTSILAEQAREAEQASGPKQRILEAEASPEFLDAKLKHLLLTMNPTGVREFELLTAGLTPDEKERARRIHFGIDPRTSSAAIQYKTVVGADGRERLVAVDPRDVGAQVIGTGETFGSGVRTPAATVSAPPVVQGEVNEAGEPVVVSAGGGGNSGPSTISGPTSTPASTQALFQSPTPQEKKTQETTGAKTVEMQIEGRAKLPKALTALESLESDTKRVEAEINEAIKLAGPMTTGFASYLKAFPTEARKLEGLIKSIGSTIGFDALTDMRQNSPTGGALGNVSDYENKALQARIATLDQGMREGDLKEALTKVKEARREALVRTRNAFERDAGLYGFQPAARDASPAAPSAPPAKEMTLEERLNKYR